MTKRSSKKQSHKNHHHGKNKVNRNAAPASEPINLIENWIYGRHAVLAASLNPQRKIARLIGTRSAMEWFADQLSNAATLPFPELETEIVTTDLLTSLLGERAVHQGIAAEISPLPLWPIETILQNCPKIVVILDQVTDPQNVGTIFRNAAAFGVGAIIMQDRHAPSLTGVVSKAAAGAIEHIPLTRVVNISRTLTALNEVGYMSIGLAGTGEALMNKLDVFHQDRPVALVLGAEGRGLRPLVAKHCEILARIDISPTMESLNVAAASAIALHSLYTQLS